VTITDPLAEDQDAQKLNQPFSNALGNTPNNGFALAKSVAVTAPRRDGTPSYLARALTRLQHDPWRGSP
jgi:hypothetical protein